MSHPSNCLICGVKGKDGKADGRLEQWEFKEGDRVVGGLIHDDVRKRWPDGKWISTSQIVSMDDQHVRTLNSLYILGERSPYCQYCRYEQRAPDHERIIPGDELSQAIRKCNHCQERNLKEVFDTLKKDGWKITRKE
jgi:hypothetical protein